MKKMVLVLSFCLLANVCKSQYGTQFANRGFENWANYGSGSSSYEPIHWHSGMSASGTFAGFLKQQIDVSNEIRPGSSGIRSVKIYSRSIIGVSANANLTNGRMNAGSMSASGSNNYNYTQRSESVFNTPIATIPDSISVWVRFKCSDAAQNAKMHSVIHGDTDFKFVANGSIEPEDKLVATALTTFHRTTNASGNYVWKRLSVPFVKDGPCNTMKYILFTITTCEGAGQGGDEDEMLVDDILLIYNPHLSTGFVSPTEYETGKSIHIPFSLTGTMSPENLTTDANEVIAQLSDATGSFDNSVELGRVTTDTSGVVEGLIPIDVPEGRHYRVRVVSTNYAMIAEDNGTDITLRPGNSLCEANELTCDVFPNPTKGLVHIDTSIASADIDIISECGEIVYEDKIHNGSHNISLDNLTPGLYFLAIRSDDRSLTRKLLKY